MGTRAFSKTLTVSLHEAIATIAHMSKPVITAVNGAGRVARLAGYDANLLHLGLC